MNRIWQDFRYALRQLWKNPGFTAMAVLTLALAIGATTSLFSVLKALVLDPFPFDHAERIAYVRSNPGQPLSTPDFKDIRDQSRSFDGIGVYRPERLNFGTEKPESLYAIQCTAGVLRTLGMEPALGRSLKEEDEAPGANPVAVISHSLWTRSFSSDPAILGRQMRLNGTPTTVVGVMPADFEFPSPWYRGHDYEVWVPLGLSPAQNRRNQVRGAHWLLCVGRLKAGSTLAGADAEVKAIGARLAKEYPDTNLHKPFLVHSMWDEVGTNTASRMRTLLGAVSLLLLVACVNVASMLLARGTRRQDEFGVRLALGVSQGSLVRMLLTETVVLSLLGSVFGILLAYGGVALFRSLIPPALIIEARRDAIQIDGMVLLFSMALALATALLAGLLPALTAARTPVVETLKMAGRSQTGTRVHHRFLRQLVVVQIAVAVLLANGAILLFASYLNVFKSNQNMDTDHVLSAEISLRSDRYSEEASRLQFWRGLRERVAALPEVQSTGITTKLPLEGGSNSDFIVDDQVYDPAVQGTLVEQSTISPGYFPAMGLHLLRGREPEPEDARREMPGVVINLAAAERLWPGVNPIGRRMRPNGPNVPVTYQVIGVVENVRQWGAEHEALPEIYSPAAGEAPTRGFLIVRTSGDAMALSPAVRTELERIDSDLPLANVRTMNEVLDAATSDRRMSTSLVNLFMGMTLLLAAVGIYGTLSYNLLQRRREIGLRIAVGALHRHIYRFVWRQAGTWLIVGLAGGLGLTLALSFILRSLVYGISPLSPASIFVGLGIVAVVALGACALPAWRASRVDPMDALRTE
ncbi:MAG: ABC transporter permease [Acidobacteriota bacterium]